MPNWVINTVSVSGDKKEIKNFFNKYFDKDGCIDFYKIIPEPKTKEECEAKYICNCEDEHLEVIDGKDWFNWYDYHIDKWGTKWGASNGYFEDENTFVFETP